MEFTTKEIINYLKTSTKTTPTKLLATGNVHLPYDNVSIYNMGESCILIGDQEQLLQIISENNLTNLTLETTARNSGVPLLNENYINIDARIEPGALIREHVQIGSKAVIMMGAVINIGAKIASKTMIDMNAVIGGRAIIGENSHIGAGAVIAGVIEPESASPCVIGDNVLIGANAVVLEGVCIGANSVIGAGSIVTKNIPANSVAIGSPARVIKTVDEDVKNKTQIVEDLR